MVASAVALIVLVVAIVIAASGGKDDPAGPDASVTTVFADQDIVTIPDASGTPDPPQQVAVVVSRGQAVVTWAAPDAVEGDVYKVLRTDGGTAELEAAATAARELTVDVDVDRPCFQVVAVRGGVESTASRQGCAT
jgi:hypothetical protein